MRAKSPAGASRAPPPLDRVGEGLQAPGDGVQPGSGGGLVETVRQRLQVAPDEVERAAQRLIEPELQRIEPGLDAPQRLARPRGVLEEVAHLADGAGEAGEAGAVRGAARDRVADPRAEVREALLQGGQPVGPRRRGEQPLDLAEVGADRGGGSCGGVAAEPV